MEVADIGPPIVSPDGKQVAFRVIRPSIERNTHDANWYIARLDRHSPPLRVAEGGVPLRDSAGLPVPEPAVWSSDGRWIYYRALIDGRTDIWQAAADGSLAKPVTGDAADIMEFRLRDDGQMMEYSVGVTREELSEAELAEYYDGIRIEENTPTSQGLFRSGYTEGRLATQRLGFWFDRVPLLAQLPIRWKQLNLRSGEKRNLISSETSGEPVPLGDLPTVLGQPQRLVHDSESGRIAFFARDADVDNSEGQPRIRLAVLPHAGAKNPVECMDAFCVGKPITNVQWRPGRDEVIFTVTDVTDGMAQAIFRWELESGVVHPVVSSTGLLNGGRDERSSCGVSETALVCVAAASDLPPRLERIGLATGERRVLFEPNAVLANDISAVVAPQVIRWTDHRGVLYSGQYFRAQASGDSPPPLFVTYYKCPGFQRGGYGDEWPLLSFAIQGISALCINAAHFQSTAVDRYSAGLAAVEGAIAFLSESGEINADRVGMGGLSFGSEVTMWLAIHSDLLVAASITSPLLSRSMYLHGSLRGASFFTGLKGAWQSGSPEATPEQWQVLAPEKNLERINAPILMQMPEQEYLWALDYAIPLMSQGKADVYAFPNEPHFKFQPRHLLAANKRNLDWFKFWLLGEVDADQAKKEQYAAWQRMEQQILEAK